jgi:hypothetical protein
MTAEEVGGPCLWKLGNLGGRWLLLRCVRVRWVQRSRTQPQTGISCGHGMAIGSAGWMRLLSHFSSDMAYFLYDINEGLRIMLFLCGNS